MYSFVTLNQMKQIKEQILHKHQSYISKYNISSKLTYQYIFTYYNITDI